MEKTDDNYRTKNAIRRLVSKIAMHIDTDVTIEKVRIGELNEIRCPYCGYDGSDLNIGRKMPYVTIGGIKLDCSNCKRTFKVKV